MSTTLDITRAPIGYRIAQFPVAQALRWEWRIFGKDLSRLAAAAGVLSETSEEPVRTETVLLSALSPHHVTLRDGRLEITKLDATNHGGLELWRPTLATTFPLDAAGLDAALAAWGMRETPRRCDFAFADRLRGVRRPHPALRAVEVRSQRTSLEVQGCSGERVSLLVDGEPWESLAFEASDPYQVRRLVARLGLSHVANANYPKALKMIVGFSDNSAIAGGVGLTSLATSH